MDYKEKYEAALARARKIHDSTFQNGIIGNGHYNNADLETIFPELSESEDERIRTVLYYIVRDFPYMETELRASGLAKEQVLAWLEKQKEREPSAWDSPVMTNEMVMDSLNIKNKSGYYKAGKFWKASTLWEAVKDKIPQRVPNRYIMQECTWRIGTLQDFADEIRNVNEVSLDYPIILDINGYIIDGAHRVVKAYLEGKDIDIVYLGDDEWPEPDYDEEKAVKEEEKQKEQKPAEWSEEDEKNFYWISTAIQNNHLTKEYADQVHKVLAWLKSLRPHWKPSEEQMGALNYAYCELFAMVDVGHNILGPLMELCDDLKKL